MAEEKDQKIDENIGVDIKKGGSEDFNYNLNERVNLFD